MMQEADSFTGVCPTEERHSAAAGIPPVTEKKA
jgi:hypothetical protein